jgi:serine/threonine-protein phosphatase 2A activator
MQTTRAPWAGSGLPPASGTAAPWASSRVPIAGQGPSVPSGPNQPTRAPWAPSTPAPPRPSVPTVGQQARTNIKNDKIEERDT